jgi:hypothetical protein
MKTQKLTFHCDRGHGWLEVPREDIDALGLADQISAYSYAMASTHKRAGMVYLEEDCDASLYLDAAKAAGYTLNIVEKYTDGDSPIRNMKRYTTESRA